MQPVPVTECIKLVINKLNLSEALGRYEALQLWEKVCGTETARVTKAIGLRGDTLTVAVKDHIWASELSNFQYQYIEKYRKIMKNCSFSKIRFAVRPALFTEKKKKIQEFNPALSELSAKDKKKASEAASCVKDEKFRPVVQRFFEEKLKHDRWIKKRGGGPCSICGVMVEKGRTLCFFCGLELERKNSENLKLLIEEEPWISYREASEKIFPLSTELYSAVKSRITENIYRDIVDSMEKAPRHRIHEIKCRIITLSMLLAGKKPAGLTDDVLRKHLPVAMYDFYMRK